MRKKDELTKEHTCMQSAHPEEMTFVLLGRDAAAPHAIREWCHERIRIGKNDRLDPQIVEALKCADTMEHEGAKWRGLCPRSVPYGHNTYKCECHGVSTRECSARSATPTPCCTAAPREATPAVGPTAYQLERVAQRMRDWGTPDEAAIVEYLIATYRKAP